jgi:secernin
MCDTFAYRGMVANRKVAWFGKNSDREPNEAHEVVFIKGKNQPAGLTLKCTYIEIPQVSTTYDVILCKPEWMWGAEMGINQHGVVIGNEAVFTKGQQPTKQALTGMDLLRLALERSNNAREAVDSITGLLTSYGQGGNCGFSHPFYYNNSFLIADQVESWVLETVDRDWVAKKFENTTAISNALSIETDWDEPSNRLHSGKNFAALNSDKLMTHFSEAGLRNSCVLKSLNKIQPESSILQAFEALRAHGENEWFSHSSLVANTVCMHAGFGPIRINQTTGSMVVDMTEDNPTIWITGTSAPCLSVFQPIWFNNYSQNTVISSATDWRKNEFFHRQALFCQIENLQLFSSERNKLENGFSHLIHEQKNRNPHSTGDISGICNTQKIEFLLKWTDLISKCSQRTDSLLFRAAWNKFNTTGGFTNTS